MTLEKMEVKRNEGVIQILSDIFSLGFAFLLEIKLLVVIFFFLLVFFYY